MAENLLKRQDPANLLVQILLLQSVQMISPLL